MSETPPRPLFLVKGDATPQEVAALTVVLQGLAAMGAERPSRAPAAEWAAPHRLVRTPLPVGAGGWRSSAMPR